MAYKDFKDLPRRTASNKVLWDNAFNIAKTSKYEGCQCGLASMVYKFFDKKSSGSSVKSKLMLNQQPFDLAEKLHKSIIRKFEKCKVYSCSKDNICSADLEDM